MCVFFMFSCLLKYICAPLFTCVGVYVMMVLASVCAPVGVEWKPQFLYWPICFVLFVLLINEIRGAACWDNPAALLRRTGPLSHGLTLFSK